MLTVLKYRVITAENGEEAVELVEKRHGAIDMILMDQSMPRKDGITATKEIRSMYAKGTINRHIPIVAVTAVVSAEAEAQFTAAGADDFLTKPLSLAKLKDTLGAFIPR